MLYEMNQGKILAYFQAKPPCGSLLPFSKTFYSVAGIIKFIFRISFWLVRRKEKRRNHGTKYKTSNIPTFIFFNWKCPYRKAANAYTNNRKSETS